MTDTSLLSLYDPSFEHDACGVGMVADLTAKPTHATVDDALTILENLEHRGATGADVDSGDGAGLLVQMPDSFVRDVFSGDVPAPGEYGIAFWMIPKGLELDVVRATIDATLDRVGLSSIGWRPVPVDSTILGPTSAASEPLFVQQLIARTDPKVNLERAMFSARKVLEHQLDVYASSCSPNVLIYKGMLTSPQLRQYFLDLRNERLTSAIAVVHSRFSTNVLPRWDLAQPFRYIAHNGEINTVRGNRNWMTARETTLESDVLALPMDQLTPIITDDMSDSASFDEVVELLVQSGRSLPHAVLMMIPEAWERSTAMSAERRDFYRYHAALMEPWDGPASITFCDGKVVGAVLGPQRTSSRALLGHQGSSGHLRERGRRAGDRALEHPEQGPPPAGTRLPRRRRTGPHHRRRGAEEHSRAPVALRPMAGRAAGLARRDRGATDVDAEPRLDRAPAEELRLQRGGPAPHHPPHGPGGRRADRFNGL